MAGATYASDAADISKQRRRFAAAFHLPALAIAAIVTALATWHGWVADDALITLRYAHNLLHGYGPVYNAGEHVQGYTHPLWFLLISAASAIEPDPAYVSVGLGSTLTLITLLALSLGLRRLTSDRHALRLMALVALLLVSSDAWLQFQTSGLENSLSNLLLTLLFVEVFAGVPQPSGPGSASNDDAPAFKPGYGANRPGAISLLCALLLLCRLDFAFLLAPLGLVVLWQQRRSPRNLAIMCLMMLPLLAWLAFARLYYGSFLPNTEAAKVGIYASLQDALGQGAVYARDWLAHEPLSVTAPLVCLLAGIWLQRNAYSRAIASGILLQLLYVTWVGGDFMRGRFLLGCFVSALLLGAFAAAPHLRDWHFERWTALAAAGVVLVAALLWSFTTPSQGSNIEASGIVNERNFWDGYQIRNYIANGNKLMRKGEDLTEKPDALRAFAEQCGPVAVDADIGTVGYLAGPKVSVIDTLGLTNKYIARLPRSTLMDAKPRPGHPYRYLPVSYLASRGDIILGRDWFNRVKRGDCSLAGEVQYLVDSELVRNGHTGVLEQPPRR